MLSERDHGGERIVAYRFKSTHVFPASPKVIYNTHTSYEHGGWPDYDFKPMGKYFAKPRKTPAR